MTPIGHIYKITNLINGKIYIGQHSVSNIKYYYFGSGLILKQAIKKHGIENFEKKIIVDNVTSVFVIKLN